MIDYLLLGHLTRDLLPDGKSSVGGTALYAALAAYRLGLHVGVVSAALDLPLYWPEQIALSGVASAESPTFENRYEHGVRNQILHATATPLALDNIPAAWRAAPILHLGPILGEVSENMVEAFPHAFIGVTPQGWMREWHLPLPAPIYYKPWQPQARLLRRIDALVLSIEDVQGDEAQVRAYATYCRIVALTRGSQGATLFIDGELLDVPAMPAIERDPTGAGDVFAAGLFCALRAGKLPVAAAYAAATLAAASVQMHGAEGLLTMPLELNT